MGEKACAHIVARTSYALSFPVHVSLCNVQPGETAIGRNITLNALSSYVCRLSASARVWYHR
jgi:hypothetical protein